MTGGYRRGRLQKKHFAGAENRRPPCGNKSRSARLEHGAHEDRGTATPHARFDKVARNFRSQYLSDAGLQVVEPCQRQHGNGRSFDVVLDESMHEPHLILLARIRFDQMQRVSQRFLQQIEVELDRIGILRLAIHLLVLLVNPPIPDGHLPSVSPRCAATWQARTGTADCLPDNLPCAARSPRVPRRIRERLPAIRSGHRGSHRARSGSRDEDDRARQPGRETRHDPLSRVPTVAAADTEQRDSRPAVPLSARSVPGCGKILSKYHLGRNVESLAQEFRKRVAEGRAATE
jgi:hypothetical protein